MSDQPKQHRSLSEISHLFLSSVRERQTGGAARPQRKPPTHQPAPAPRPPSVDLTPEEFQEVLAGTPEQQAPRVPPIKAVLASHIGNSQLEPAMRYARHIAASGKRVGLIAIAAGEFRLITFDSSEATGERPAATAADCLDARAMREAINELNYDLDLWLLAVSNPRVPEGRKLLRAVGQWVILATGDRDGLVACYKVIKSLAESPHPRLSLAVMDARNDADARHAIEKIAGACQQFLDWQIFPEPPVSDARHVGEYDAMHCLAHDKAQLASAAHWQVVEELIEAAKKNPAEPAPAVANAQMEPKAQAQTEHSEESMPRTNAQMNIAEQKKLIAEEEHAAPAAVQPMLIARTQMAEVIDLPEGGGESVVPTIMRHMGDLIECPLRPPTCPEAHLAVSRERRMVLVASAGQELSRLTTVAQAYHWAQENAELLAMAMPQFAMDAHQPPQLRLLVDQADLDAEALSPLLQIQTITLHTYRRVKWGMKTGLLLDAA